MWFIFLSLGFKGMFHAVAMVLVGRLRENLADVF